MPKGIWPYAIWRQKFRKAAVEAGAGAFESCSPCDKCIRPDASLGCDIDLDVDDMLSWAGDFFGIAGGTARGDWPVWF